MNDIESMTANEIAAEIAGLRKLARSGDITLAQAQRLSDLEFASKRIRVATHRRSWRLW